ncbi:hypothetical protein KUTeg_017119 [Tegillarca granosa]|uniref:J domain-containing protein n=1 Tax=Tegillarca granosa TaxID=220873 RepID=A0ABQ9EMS6_TEGGR|nr:hypothetical protein KUTeg_017119 [Tegillarca granosa]
MPTHNNSEIGSTFPWESFGSPGGTFSPSALSADPAPDFVHCQKLLSHSRSSPTILEPDPRPADNSVTSGISFNDASQEGKDAYAEAMQNWSSFSPTYDPFGSTSDVIGKNILSKPQEISDHKRTTDYINNDLSDSKKKTNTVNNSNEKCENVVKNGGTGNSRNGGRHRGFLPLQSTFDQEYVDEWLGYIFEKLRHGMSSLWSLIFTAVILAFGLIAYLVSGCVYIVTWIWSKTYVFTKTRIFKSKYFAGRLGDSGAKRKIGLDENITLPSTGLLFIAHVSLGDEAMQRLLACKGKDPYSILGLRSDATDDDIRKYYRKQAVLVHPDKNKQPGAEEAFKILGHAFELIGESKEFNDLLTKLKEKIQEGDVWAETSMLGFLWHYYACMEGKIYDITEWVACKKDFFKHMQPSAHHVFYRIATEGSRDKGHQSRSGEAELEDFINHLFHQAMHQEGNTSGNQWQQPASSTTANQNYSSPTSNTTQGNKKARRRKKKH